MSHTPKADPSRVTQKDNRTALIHVRLKPVLRETIERDAKAQGVTASALVREMLVQHYETRAL